MLDTCPVLTGIEAHPAVDAPTEEELDLRPKADPLGIVAPETVKRASLQKDRRSDARPVVYGESLNVEDNTRHVENTIEDGRRMGEWENGRIPRSPTLPLDFHT
jgi:hypothetical protein